MTAGSDNFIGWDLGKKIAWLTGIQEARLTGQVVKLETARGVYTEFNINQTNVTQTLRELEQSIASDPDFDATNPVHLACAKNTRAGITRPNFGGAYGGQRGY
jgi:hypothetical protein